MRRNRQTGWKIPTAAFWCVTALAVLLTVLSGLLYLGYRLRSAERDSAVREAEEQRMLVAQEEADAKTAKEALNEAETRNAELEKRVDELETQVDELNIRLTIALSTPVPLPTPTPAPKTAPGALSPGDTVQREALEEELSLYFTAETIERDGDVFARINGKSYRDNPNIRLEDLRYLRILHYNFDHEIQSGEMIVNRRIADDVLNVFRELFDAEYEIQSVFLVDNYWTWNGTSTDTASIDVNNTSAFNYREATGSNHLSNHAYGLAIDINPQQNPYVWYSGGRLRYAHDNAAPYVDRTVDDPHVIKKDDVCYSIFIKYGFTWGGNWKSPIDYQHFEKKLG